MKRDKYLDLAREVKKLWSMKVIMILTVSGAQRNNPQRLGKRAGRVGNRKMSGDHPNYSIVKIGLNTQKTPGDLRRLAVTQTAVKDYQLMLV